MRISVLPKLKTCCTWGMLRRTGSWCARTRRSRHQVRLGPGTAVPQNSVHRADARNGVRVTYPLGEELVSYLPGEHPRIFLFESQDLLHNCRCSYLLQKYFSVRKNYHIENNIYLLTHMNKKSLG